MANTISNNRISTLINSQVPFFVRNDHANTVVFLEKYYEYLEQNSKVVNRAKNILSFQNIDLTEDEFAEKLYSTFMVLMPKNVLADKNILIKHIKDFYRAKGTEKSVKFLFNILYNTTDIEFYYPKKDILRASDGKWFIQKSLRVFDTYLNGTSNTSIFALEKYIGRQISGNTSLATAIVERVDTFYEQGTKVDELILSNIDGNFDNGETIFTTYPENDSNIPLRSNIFGGILNSITITNAGTGYSIGDPAIIVSATGNGACALIAQVSTGNISSISVLSGGAGYKSNDYILITGGGGGSGANAQVSDVSDDSAIHPNSYNIVSSTISLEANTALDNASYSNLSSTNANSWIANGMSYWTYANTGPASTIFVNIGGSGYTVRPTLSILANTTIQSLGILGRMQIINGGSGYQVGDKIEFINVLGGYGAGASGNVTNVNGGGTITQVKFEGVPGHFVGGSGYDINFLPKANVISGTGSNANIAVTALLGAGANLISVSSTQGAIERIIIYSGGSGYTSNTTIDLSASGDGTANAIATVVEGLYSYPGRYLNDDGHLSSYNFLEDRDYYQIFSYVIRSKVPIAKYRDVLKGLTHPSGTKLFGEYLIEDDTTSNMICPCEPTDVSNYYVKLTNYTKIGNTINVFVAAHQLESNMNVALEFISGGFNNVKNGIYQVETFGDDYFTVKMKSKLSKINILNPGSGYNSNGFLTITGDGKGANAKYVVNSNGSIISVQILEPGINYTYKPTISANAVNTITALFSSNITFANSTSGQVYAPVTVSYQSITSDKNSITSDSSYITSDVA